MNGRILLFVMLIASAPDARAAEAGGDPIAGRATFQRICQNCHSNEIGVNKVRTQPVERGWPGGGHCTSSIQLR